MPDDARFSAPDYESGDIPDMRPERLAALKNLIDSFNLSTARLRESYDALQTRVERLDIQLEQTNRELAASLDEQERLSNHLTSILASLSSGVLAVDTAGAITLFNRGAEMLVGIPQERALGRPYREIMGRFPDELTPLPLLADGSGAIQFEKRITDADGHLIPVGCSVSPLVNARGERIGAVEIFMDLSRIRALEDELTRRERLAMLGQMAATMAHKIRNPLGGISGFAGLLAFEMSDNPGAVRMVKKIEEGVHKLNRIITSLLAYSADRPLDIRTADIGALARALLPGDGRDGCRIEVSEPAGPVTADVDPSQLGDALTAIVRNACEACEADAGSGMGNDSVTVTVLPGDADWDPPEPVTARLLARVRAETVDAGGGTVLIVIADRRTGMTEAELGNLFVPFYTTRENGIGLGLANARKIVEAHRGSLVIESTAGKGTAVGIRLPRWHAGT